MTWVETLGALGDWQLTGGSGGGGSHARSDWGQSGSGSYGYETGIGYMSGDTKQDGKNTWSDDSSWTVAVDGNGEWQLTGGSGTTTAHSEGNWSCSGAGLYNYSTPYASASGLMGEYDSDNWFSDRTVTSNVVSGQWVNDGSGSGEDHGKDGSWYVGAGNYSVTLTGSTEGGTLAEIGGQDQHTDTHWWETLGSDGTWQQTSASADGGSSGDDSVHYVGTGAYSLTLANGSSSGTTTNDTERGSSFNTTWSAAVDGSGSWQLELATVTSESHADGKFTYTGGGAYSTVDTGLSIGGMTSASGGENSSSKYTGHRSIPLRRVADPNRRRQR